MGFLLTCANWSTMQWIPFMSEGFPSQSTAVTYFSLSCDNDRITPQSIAAGGSTHAIKIV